MTEQVRIGRYPLIAPTEHPEAAGGRWLYLSPVWDSIIMSIIASLEYKGLWIGTPEDQDRAKGFVLEIEGQNLTPETETVYVEVPVETIREVLIAGKASEGYLSFTIEELWECFMFELAGKLKWIGGVLHIRDGCCNWIPVPSDGDLGAGGLPMLQGTTSSFEDYVNSIDPNKISSPVPYIQGKSAASTPVGMGSNEARCVKATALVNLTFDGLSVIYTEAANKVDEANVLVPIVSAILTAATIVYPPAGKIMGAVGAFLANAGRASAELMDEIGEYLTDADRTRAICDLTDQFDVATDITSKDISAFYSYFVLSEWQFAATLGEALGLVDLEGLVQQARLELSSGRCGCGAITGNQNQFNPGLLAESSQWCRVFDYTTYGSLPQGESAGAWQELIPYAGFNSTNYSNGKSNIDKGVPVLGEGVFLDGVAFQLEYIGNAVPQLNIGGNSGGADAGWWHLNQPMAVDADHDYGDAGAWYHYTVDPQRVNEPSSVNFQVSVAGSESLLLKKTMVWGRGNNPYGGNNCL